MPRYNVKNDKDEWACFSSICDGFITEFMPRAKYQVWREREYGIHCGKIEEANLMEYSEAMRIILCQEMQKKLGKCIDCGTCKFWNNKANKCEIIERQREISN